MAKNQSRFAEYDLLKEILPQISQIADFSQILNSAEETCSKIFEQPEEPIVSANTSKQDCEQRRCESSELEAQSVTTAEMAKSYEKLSETQTLSSSTSSPMPRISNIKGHSRSTKANTGSSAAKDSLRHKKMHAKKRRVICKKML